MSRLTVFFDACVLFPTSVRDLAIQLAFDEFYQAKWSSLVEEQLVRNLEKKVPGTKGKLDRLVSKMRDAVPDYSAEPTKATLAKVKKSKTDKTDQAILAAAIDSVSNYLVTYNLKDFDQEFAEKNKVIVIHPDEFFYQIISSDITAAILSLHKMSDRTQKPKRTPKDFCEAFKKNNLKKVAELFA